MGKADAVPFFSGIDFKNNMAYDVRLMSITGLGDLSSGDGAVGYMAASGDKRIAFRDTEAGALIYVPRLDRNEAVTGQYSFAPGVVRAPFILGTNAQGQKVTGLNADLLDGYDSSSAATASTIALRYTDGRLKGGTPVLGEDLTTKDYVDGAIAGVNDLRNADCATKSNVNIASAPSSIDGHSLSNGDVVLLMGQTSGEENGLYLFTSAGASMSRTTDADEDSEVNPGMTVFVINGTAYGATTWQLVTPEPITVDTTALTFLQIGAQISWNTGSGVYIDGQTIGVSIGSSGSPSGSQYTVGAIVYADSTSTLDQIALGSANTVLGINAGASGYEHKAIQGTASEISVVHGTETITIGLVDPIAVAKGGTGTSTAQTEGQVIIAGPSGVFTSSANCFFNVSTGRLGVGTNTPESTLDVRGNAQFKNDSASQVTSLNASGSSQNTAANIRLICDDSADAGYEGVNLAHSIKGADGGTMVFEGLRINAAGASQATLFKYEFDNERWLFYADNAAKLYVNSTGVGVLRNPTAYALEVAGVVNAKRYSTGFVWTADSKTAAIFEGSATGTIVNIVAPNSTTSGLWFGRPGDEDAGQINYDHANSRLSLYTGGTVRVYIDSAGKTGIGRIPAAYPLEVEGSVFARGYYGENSSSSVFASLVRTDSNANGEEVYVSLGNTSSGVDLWRLAKRGPTYAAGSQSELVLYYDNGTKQYALVGKNDGAVHIGWSGNVSVGSSAPSEKLDVHGNARCAYLKLDRGSTNTIQLAAPAGLGNDLTYTWPATIVAGYMRSDSSGNLSLTATIDAGILTGTAPAGVIPEGGVTQHEAALSIDWTQLTSVPTSFTPSAHVFATTSGLGSEHTVSGLTSGMVLRATGASTAAFGALLNTDLPGNLVSTTTIGGFDIARGDVFLLAASTTQVINHNLGTRMLHAFIYDSTTDQIGFTGVEATTDNSCTVKFSETPDASRYYLVLMSIPT